MNEWEKEALKLKEKHLLQLNSRGITLNLREIEMRDT